VADPLSLFERIARRAHQFTQLEPDTAVVHHPFDVRNIHPSLPPKVRKLFDDGHYAEATFEAFKYIDKLVSHHAGIKDSGHKLMMAAFDGDQPGQPKIQLTPLKEISEIDEQKGFRFVFAGSVWAIRNPRGHEYSVSDDVDTCLDHLSFISMLIRRLETAGYVGE
jgi:uncharacterized protein (TIGR02391 family)